jgi:chromosome segregation ATPase
MADDTRDCDKLQRLAFGLDKKVKKLTAKNSELTADLTASRLEIDGLREKNAMLDALVRDIQAKYESDESRITELTSQIDSLHELQANHLTMHSTAVDALRQELAVLHSRDSDIAELRASIERFETEKAELQQIAEAADRDRISYRARNLDMAKIIRKMQGQLATAKAGEPVPADGELNELIGKLVDVESAFSEKDDEIARLKSGLSGSPGMVDDRKYLSEIEGLKAELRNQRAEATFSVERLELEKRNLAMELRQSEERAGQVSEQLATAEKRIATLTKQVEKRKREIRNLKSQVSTDAQKISLFDVERMSLTGRITELEGQLESAKSVQTDQFTEFQSEKAANLAAIERLTAERDAALARSQTAESENARLASQGAQAQSELAALSAAHSRTSEQLALVTAQHSEKELECASALQQVSELTAALRAADKDSKGLKALLQRAVESDQRSQQRIGQLQAELAVLSERLVTDAGAQDHGMLERVVALELANQALERRLSEARPSADAEEKVARLTTMLEKAKVMWSDAAMQNKELMTRLRDPNLSLCPGETFAIQASAGNAAENGSVVNAYLRATLIQFFGQDASRRGELVPLILQLIGCSEQQKRAAQRQWDRSNQLIHKTTGLFGF